MNTPSLFKSIAHAWRGLRLCFKTERSFRIQIAATLLAFGAAAIFPLQTWERAMVVFVVMTVLVLELINSSLERLVDLVKPRLSEYVGDIKDLMAGAVLIAVSAAIIIGFLLFSPHVIDSLQNL